MTPDLDKDTVDSQRTKDSNKRSASSPSPPRGLQNADTTAQSIEKSSSKIQSTAVEIQTPFAQATELASNTSPPVRDVKASTSCPGVPTPNTTVQTNLGTNSRGNVVESTPDVESEEDEQEKFRHLRTQLQRGLLPTDRKPKSEEMKAMSLHLGIMERIENPSPNALRDNSICKLLKAIGKSDGISEDDEFTIKERAQKLHKKWKASLQMEDPTTSSTNQSIGNLNTDLNAITDKPEPFDISIPQQPLETKTNSSITDLAEKTQSKRVVESEQLNGDHIIDPANEHPPLPRFILPVPQAKSKIECLVIDLTSDDELDANAGDPSVGTSVAKDNQRSQVSPRQSQKNQSGPRFSPTKSDTKKRKRADGTDNEGTLASTSNSAEIPAADDTPKRNRLKRKTSPGKHLGDEMQWLNASVQWIDGMIKATETEVVATREKRKQHTQETRRLREEIETDMQSVKERRKKLIEQKKYLLAWGAQDQEVTNEWSPSK